MNRCLALLVPFIALGASACQTVAPDGLDSDQADSVVTVSGSLFYRERIALPPGMTMTVTVSDISLADAPAAVIAQSSRRLEGEQVPLAFTLAVPATLLKPQMRYSLRGTITDPSGQLAWSTDTVYPVTPSPALLDLGMLQLVRVDAGSGAAP